MDRRSSPEMGDLLEVYHSVVHVICYDVLMMKINIICYSMKVCNS